MARAHWQIVIAAGFAAGLAFAAGAQPMPPPAATHAPAEVDFAYFHDRLAQFGRWFHHPAWGEVWQPDSGSGFRPYFYGNWEYTSDYGWMWVSSEPYGDIVYHYGRWVYDPDDGWLWVPGYVWAPSWVVWRETDGYVGWLPMPPDYANIDAGAETPETPVGGIDLFYGYQGYYGINFINDVFPYLWVFCTDADFGHHDRRHYVTDRKRVRDLFGHSRDHTDYRHDRDGDRIVDRSIDPRELEERGHSPLMPLPAARFLRRDVPVTTVSLGREIFRREHEHRAPPEGTRLPPAFGHADAPASTAGGAVNPPIAPSADPRRVPRLFNRRAEPGQGPRLDNPRTDNRPGIPLGAETSQPSVPAPPAVRVFRGRGHPIESGAAALKIAGPAAVAPAAPPLPVPHATAPIPQPPTPAPIAPVQQSQPSTAPPAPSTAPAARFGRHLER